MTRSVISYEIWRKRYPDRPGWWWMKSADGGHIKARNGDVFSSPIVVEVFADAKWGTSYGELRMPEEKKWRDLLDFENCLWAGPILEPMDASEMPKLSPLKKKTKKSKAKKRKRISGEALLSFKKKWDFECAVCGWTPPPAQLTLIETHHLVPFSRGGSNKRSNLILLCPNHHRIAHLTNGKKKEVCGREELIARIREFERIQADE